MSPSVQLWPLSTTSTTSSMLSSNTNDDRNNNEQTGSSGSNSSSSSGSNNSSNDDGASTASVIANGLYKKFADHAIERLMKTGWAEELPIEDDLAYNESPAKGPAPSSQTSSTNGTTGNSIVRITTRAMIPSSSSSSVIRYARVALLETVPTNLSSSSSSPAAAAVSSSSSSEIISSDGIQVLNFVVLPASTTTLPVLGIDLVSLPGGRHLLLMDAQPMVQPNKVEYDDQWNDWYNTHVVANVKENEKKEVNLEECNEDDGDHHDDNGSGVTLDLKFPWGGDFPEPVRRYVSKYPLWTRLQDMDDPINVIQTEVWDAFVDHLDLYVDLLENETLPDTTEEWEHGSQQQQQQQYETNNGCDVAGNQGPYLEYRKNNDPAKPMLKSLYGEDWTQRLLDGVLFPER